MQRCSTGECPPQRPGHGHPGATRRTAQRLCFYPRWQLGSRTRPSIPPVLQLGPPTYTSVQKRVILKRGPHPTCTLAKSIASSRTEEGKGEKRGSLICRSIHMWWVYGASHKTSDTLVSADLSVIVMVCCRKRSSFRTGVKCLWTWHPSRQLLTSACSTCEGSQFPHRQGSPKAGLLLGINLRRIKMLQ